MKKSFPIICLAFLAACSNVTEEQISNEDTSNEAVDTYQEKIRITSESNDYTPTAAHISGNIAIFEDVDSDANVIEMRYRSLTVIAPHLDGRVMTNIVLTNPVLSYLDAETHLLVKNSEESTFTALGCQSDSVYTWDYDSMSESGIIEITPTGDNTWLVDYKLDWSDDSLEGFVSIEKE